jgi:hypothetical protein
VLLGTPVKFTQRALEQRLGGLIHDMDMAGRVNRLPERAPAFNLEANASNLAFLFSTLEQPPEQPVLPQKGSRTACIFSLAVAV